MPLALDLYQHLAGRIGPEPLFDRSGEPLPSVEVRPDRLREAIAALREPPFSVDSLESINGVDLLGYPGPEANRDAVAWRNLYDARSRNFMIVYQLLSVERNIHCIIKAVIPGFAPHVDTIDDLFGNANWLEREIYDLLGIIFDGSRDLRRILLPEDWEGYPLRRDYRELDQYDGMSTRTGPFTLSDAGNLGAASVERWMQEEAEKIDER
jgi:NADH-quinone oxidoreductase subunit C